MSHSRSVEYCKFYNKQTCASGRPDVSPATGAGGLTPRDSPFFARAAMKPGDLGYKCMARDVGTPDATHHLHYDKLVGISHSRQERLHVFQELPGRTFSSDAMTRFTMSSTATARRVPKK